MKRLLALCLLLWMPQLTSAAEKRWLRRATAIAACAASGMDAYSSIRLNPYARQGLVREANPFFARRDGTVSPLRIISIKAAQCGASLVAERWLKNDKVAIGSNFAQIAAYSYVTANNLDHWFRLRGAPRVTGNPAAPAAAPAVAKFDLSGSR